MHTTIALTNPKSPTNVGAVMRAAGCFAVDQVIYSGQRYARASKFQTDTKKATNTIPLLGVESLLDSVPADAKLVCVDLVEGATPLPAFEHPENAVYLFGPEDGSISQDVINEADHVVYVPTLGCLNLAASVNVVMYDRSTKLKQVSGGDELIRQSRDTNNKTKIT